MNSPEQTNTHTLLADQYFAIDGDTNNPRIFKRGTRVAFERPVNGDYCEVSVCCDGSTYEAIIRKDKLAKAK